MSNPDNTQDIFQKTLELNGSWLDDGNSECCICPPHPHGRPVNEVETFWSAMTEFILSIGFVKIHHKFSFYWNEERKLVLDAESMHPYNWDLTAMENREAAEKLAGGYASDNESED